MKINEIVKKIDDIKSSVSGTDFGGNKEVSAALNNILGCLADVANELLTVKEQVNSIDEDCQSLSDRVDELEETVDSGCFDDDEVVATIDCPYCKEEVVIGPEFLTGDDPKIVCQHCKNEIEILTSGCGCGCGCEEDDEDCDCDCDCDGENCNCNEDSSCEGDCGCGKNH